MMYTAMSSPRSTLAAHDICLRATPFEILASAHNARSGLHISVDMYTVPAEDPLRKMNQTRRCAPLPQAGQDHQAQDVAQGVHDVASLDTPAQPTARRVNIDVVFELTHRNHQKVEAGRGHRHVYADELPQKHLGGPRCLLAGHAFRDPRLGPQRPQRPGHQHRDVQRASGGEHDAETRGGRARPPWQATPAAHPLEILRKRNRPRERVLRRRARRGLPLQAALDPPRKMSQTGRCAPLPQAGQDQQAQNVAQCITYPAHPDAPTVPMAQLVKRLSYFNSHIAIIKKWRPDDANVMYMAMSSPRSTLAAHIVCLRATPFEILASAHNARNGLHISADMYTVPAEANATPTLTRAMKHVAKVCPQPKSAYNKKFAADMRAINRSN
eukprot:CAMPEP_0198612586 /NCGR_PEP_ID=MMETSP1462-20131121/157967_1 /TAXON_ID=1333877 /ORGANISM="Brandtodinium nutriculum, Strain RCC3387" /LENGTH=383 /DNA_ID=CAMNT_0044344387 /DNA_START=214 /DNA_END=1367 /DNA_ORIENTATION=+